MSVQGSGLVLWSSISTCLSQALQNPRLPEDQVQVKQMIFRCSPTGVLLGEPYLVSQSCVLPLLPAPSSPREEASLPSLWGFQSLVPYDTGPG